MGLLFNCRVKYTVIHGNMKIRMAWKKFGQQFSTAHSLYLSKFLDAGIQDVSTSISIVHDLIERYHDNDDGDESDKHI